MRPLPQSPESLEPHSEGIFYSTFGFLLEVFIGLMVRMTGRRIRKTDAPWLHCYLGKQGLIGTGVYQRIAQEEHLQLRNSPHAGLIPDFEVLRGPSFDPGGVHPESGISTSTQPSIKWKSGAKCILLDDSSFGFWWNFSAEEWIN
jgi:hypothetical protein